MPLNEPTETQINSWQKAETNAADWMRYWGFRDAVVTTGGADGGIDVRATDALAQVKFEAKQVGRPALQNLVGAQGRDTGKQLLFFTGAGYASPAIEYANNMGIALFEYTLTGRMRAINHEAALLVTMAETTQDNHPQTHATSGTEHAQPSGSPRGPGCFSVLLVLYGLWAIGMSLVRAVDLLNGQPTSEDARWDNILGFGLLIGPLAVAAPIVAHHLRSRSPDTPSKVAAAKLEVDPWAFPDVAAAMHSRKKIAAVAALREHTGLGLSEAVAAVDAAMRHIQ